jgi:lipoate-protein ligase A
MTTYTPTLVFEQPDFIDEFKKFTDKFGVKIVNEKIDEPEEVLVLKNPDDGFNDLRQTITDINNGNLDKNSISEEEFIEEISKW